MSKQTENLSLLLDNRIVQLLKIDLAFAPLAMFIGSTRFPDSLFTGVITVNGIFLSFSVWFLSNPIPFLFDKSKIESSVKNYVRFFLERKRNDRTLPEDDRLKFSLILENESLVDQLTGEINKEILPRLDSLAKNIVATVTWLSVVLPLIISTSIAMAGLLHEGAVSHTLGLIAIYLMFYGIISAIGELIRLKTRFDWFC